MASYLYRYKLLAALILSVLVVAESSPSTHADSTHTDSTHTDSTHTDNTGSTHNHHNTDCDVSPDALTDQFGVHIPQTCIQVGKRKRCYYTYIPECASTDASLVYDIHGYGECPRSFSAYSGWFQKATDECFVVVWPTGNVESDVADAPCWSLPGGLQIGEDEGETTSCCCQKDDEAVVVHGDDETTDLDFLHQMAFYLVRDVPTLSDSKVSIDTRRIYMSGHANGCMLAHAMAARHSDLVAAVACMAGAAITAFPLSYEPVPTWTIAGALDEIIPIGGSRLPSGSIQFPGQQAGFQLLADSHACSNVYSNSTEVHDMNLPDYPLAGTLHVQTAFGCINGAVVQHLTLVTAGHLLYKGVSEVFPSNAADTSVDTTGMAWGFMTSFMSGREPALQQAIDLDEIKDLLENEEEEIREEELLHHDRPSTSHSDEGDAMENVDTSQDRDGNDIEQPVETTSEAVDEVASTWQGLRGISESEALSS